MGGGGLQYCVLAYTSTVTRSISNICVVAAAGKFAAKFSIPPSGPISLRYFLFFFFLMERLQSLPQTNRLC